MPFTPFHLGAGLLVKPATQRRFSLIAFGLAQLAIDIEPGVGMIRGSDVLHGPSHTVIGALVIAYLVTLVSPWFCKFFVGRWNREVRRYKLDWLAEPEEISRTAIYAGAFFGTLSHLALDSLMHHDIHIFAPFSDANPLLDLVSHDGVYQLCAVMALFGTLAWIVQKWRSRPL